MRKILIIGASSGIGLSLARRLTRDETAVVSVSRSKPDLAVEQHHTFDVRSSEDPPSVDGTLDGLVYCPGSITLRPFRASRLQDYRDDLEINFLCAVKMVRHFLPILAKPGSSILLFSSVAAALGLPMHGSIAAAKGAVEAWVRTMASELAPDIRINAIAPSLVMTPLSARLTDTAAKMLAARERHPLERVGTSEEIASLAAFLLSPDASWITGQIMHADGGLQAVRR